MAVVKSTTFQGSPIFDVDPDVETWARVIKNAQGDIAGTLDDLTSTSAANPIDHSGPGAGSLLGIPWVNQAIGRVVDFDTGNNKDGGAQDASSGGTVQHAWVVVVEPGEDTVVVEVSIGSIIAGADFAQRFLPRLRLCLTSDFTTAAGNDLELPMTPSGNLPTVFSATHTGLTAGVYLAIFQVESINVLDGTELSCTIVDCVIKKPRTGISVVDVVRDGTNPVPVVAPDASSSLFHQSMDESLFVSGDALTGWHTSRLDRNINGLMEHLTGAGAGSNEDYTHTESALEDPTRDRFDAPCQKTHANKPIPVIPIVSVCHGGIKSGGGYLVNPSSGASVAARQAFAPYPTSATNADFGGVTIRIPDVPSGMLHWAVLVGQSSGVGFGDVRVGGRITASASTLQTPTALTGASHLAYATGTLDFNPDDVASFFARMSQVAGAFHERNYCLIASCLWVEP